MKNKEKAISLLKQYKHIFLFLFFAGNGIWYFVLQNFITDSYVIHTSLDDMIPFLPAFIIPYIIWYLYVPVPMIYMFLFDKDNFIKQCKVLFSGMYLSLLVFTIFPTSIDFRPALAELTDGGVLSRLCGMIFQNDKPVNVCPSLHCYESIAIHITTFSSPKLKNYKVLKAVSAVLAITICLSTLFVKQHSVIDFIVAALLVIPIYFIVYNKDFSLRLGRSRAKSELRREKDR